MTGDLKPKVMIMDENSGIRQFYAVELAESGYEVVTVGDAAVFKEAISNSKPDLVLIDPWIGGQYRWDMVSDIKRGDSLTPVLLCLAFDAPFPRDLVAAEGFVLKSMFTDDLLAMV